MSYVQHTADDVERMLKRIAVSSIEELFRSIPDAIRLKHPLKLPEKRTESEIWRLFEELAARNQRLDQMPSFLGAGVYDRFIPAAIDHLSSRGEFSTAYTPYQPEVSQGTLQAIFEYQTMIARLTGMEISNASMYEGGTALVEAVLMAYAVHDRGHRVLVSDAIHPEYRTVLETYVKNHPVQIESLPLSERGDTDFGGLPSDTDGVFAVVIQNPNFFGNLEEGRRVREILDNTFSMPLPELIVVADPISLGILEPPGSYGADIVVGDGQGLGNEPNFGGPTFSFFATTQEKVRKIPGRIVGETADRDGRRGYVLTFQTREQHIRRQRATSNICTNQGLCCLRGAMFMSLLGEQGIRQIAELSTRMAHYTCRRLCELPDVELVFKAPFFQEFVVEMPLAARTVYHQLLRRGVRGGLPLERYFPERTHQMMFATTEMTTVDDVHALRLALEAVLAEAESEQQEVHREERE